MPSVCPTGSVQAVEPGAWRHAGRRPAPSPTTGTAPLRARVTTAATGWATSQQRYRCLAGRGWRIDPALERQRVPVRHQPHAAGPARGSRQHRRPRRRRRQLSASCTPRPAAAGGRSPSTPRWAWSSSPSPARTTSSADRRPRHPEEGAPVIRAGARAGHGAGDRRRAGARRRARRQGRQRGDRMLRRPTRPPIRRRTRRGRGLEHRVPDTATDTTAALRRRRRRTAPETIPTDRQPDAPRRGQRFDSGTDAASECVRTRGPMARRTSPAAIACPAPTGWPRRHTTLARATGGAGRTRSAVWLRWLRAGRERSASGRGPARTVIHFDGRAGAASTPASPAGWRP